jgi:hypothetical protein
MSLDLDSIFDPDHIEAAVGRGKQLSAPKSSQNRSLSQGHSMLSTPVQPNWSAWHQTWKKRTEALIEDGKHRERAEAMAFAKILDEMYTAGVLPTADTGKTWKETEARGVVENLQQQRRTLVHPWEKDPVGWFALLALEDAIDRAFVAKDAEALREAEKAWLETAAQYFNLQVSLQPKESAS